MTSTYERHLASGLDPDAAAQAAIAEFGDSHTITRAFASAAPGRRTARILLAAGPLVGAPWALLLITTRAWTWPVPTPARIALALTLASAIGLLACAARSHHYSRARYTALAGTLAFIALDAALLAVLALTATAWAWPIAAAVAASTARLGYDTRTLALILTG